MLMRFANIFRLGLLVSIVGLSGCSIFTPKPEVVDSQADVLGPIPPKLQQAFGDALGLMQNEEFSAAEKLLIEITLKFPSYAGPWSNLAIAQSKQEKFEEALASIDKALQQDENFCQALSFKGVVLRELGRFKLAKEQYLAALACNPNDILTVYNLGVLSDLYLHDNVTALSYYQQYLISQGEQQDETVKSWVVDLKRRVPADVQKSPAENVENAAESSVSAQQLAGEE
jgi:tetratricopeptide (TPR) repeat protein